MVNDIKDLPKILPLLSVQGASLFPKGHLPLPIHSPKHFSIIADVWHTHRVVGIVQPHANDMDLSPVPSFYTSGSAGKITEISEVDDGKLYAVVTGICRFNILREIDPTADIRRAEVDYSAYTMDLAAETDFSLDRSKLLKELNIYFKRLEIEANWEELRRIPNEKLITTLAMACPFTSSERQALLQCCTMIEQSKLITALIEMANKEPNIFNITCH